MEMACKTARGFSRTFLRGADAVTAPLENITPTGTKTIRILDTIATELY